MPGGRTDLRGGEYLAFLSFFSFQMKVVFLFKNRTKHWGSKKEGHAMAEDRLGGPPKQCHDVSHGTFENVFIGPR